MRNKTHQSRLYIIIISVIVTTLVGKIHAQGPNAPEAASFEPVDATDMVNLVTGDFTYVLPLLNVPSPEGGYPIALSYHAGIAMDQEASWVGLGWNINPGAINRSVNGNPDDWKNGLIKEFTYDEGGSTYSETISIGYGIPGKLSVGVAVSWGSNQSLGGSVSIGLGPAYASIGTSGLSAGVGLSDNIGVGASVGYDGSVSASLSLGFGNNSLSIGIGHGPGGFRGNVGFTSKFKGQGVGYFSPSSASIGISFATSGTTISGNINGNGTSVSLRSNNSIKSSDYNLYHKSSSFGIVTPFGYFSYGKNETTWDLNKTEYQLTQGALYLYDDTEDAVIESLTKDLIYKKNKLSSYYDTFEVNTLSEFEQSTEDHYATSNNGIFPNFDNYIISGQGISGNILPILSNDLSLKITNSKEFITDHNLPKVFVEYGTDENNALKRKPVNFDFQAFTNSYLNVLPSQVGFSVNNITFNPPVTLPIIPSTHSFSDDDKLIYLSNSFNETKHRLRKGRFVEYFTISEINSGSAASSGYLREANNYELSLKHCGYKNPNYFKGATEYNHRYKNTFDNSIAAYKITLEDGKTYHYSLPVYQVEQVRRLYGIMGNKTEHQAQIDRMQVNPYATHWLLTAITGPDYVKKDINRAYPDEGDYGYWVRFDYGNWSDGFIWKTPTKNINVFGKAKEYTWGRKQLYYLDKIKTRTHTALFVKKLRNDNKSNAMTYKNLGHNFIYSSEDEMDVDADPSLALDKILLLKNEDANGISKTNGLDLVEEKEYSHFLFATYLSSESNPDKYVSDPNAEIQYRVNKNNEVLDVNDVSLALRYKAIKTIEFNHDYSLCVPYTNPGAPAGGGPGKLTLKSINFYGKGIFRSISPPVQFGYGFNEKHRRSEKSDFGYYKNKPQAWSLSSIKTPTGGSINVNYEPDSYSTLAINNGKVFTSKLKFTFLTKPPTNGSPSKIQIKVELDKQDPTTEGIWLSDHFDASKNFFMDMWYSTIYNGSSKGYDRGSINIESQMAEIISTVTQSQMTIEVMATCPIFKNSYQHNAEPVSVLHASGPFATKVNKNLPRLEESWERDGEGHGYSMRHTLIGNKFISSNSSGLRVKEIVLNDGSGNSYKTSYNYNNPDSGVSSGVLSYYPEQDYNVNQQAPYISLLPGPAVSYEHVTETNQDISRKYKFKVLKKLNNTSNPDIISFGDLLKIKCIDYNPMSSIFIKYLTVYNNLQSLGQIEEFKVLNSENQIISETKNQYSNIDNEFSLGQFKQSFHSKKQVLDTRNPPYYPISYPEMTNYYGNVSSKIDIYNSLKSTITTQGGYTNMTSFNKHDLVTNHVLETITVDSKGNEFKTELTPAYTKPQYNSSLGYGMGSKVDNDLNKNMLSQEAMTKTYIKVGTQWKETSADITTWNNYWTYTYNKGVTGSPSHKLYKIWRKHKTFVWDGSLDPNGTYSGFTGDDDSFVWTVGQNITQTNTKWKNTSTITKYNHFSMPLEIKDINNNFVTTKMCDNNTKVLFTSNSKYGESFYTGAEYISPTNNNYIGQQIYMETGTQRSNDYAHTGNYSVYIPSGKTLNVDIISGQYSPGKYKVSIWVKKENANYLRIGFSGSPNVFNGEQLAAGDWIQLNHYITLNGSSGYIYLMALGANLYVDDLRVHPVSSSMTSYVYNKWNEISYIISNNGLASKFEYDMDGRLTNSYLEVADFKGIGTGGFKRVRENRYGYKN